MDVEKEFESIKNKYKDLCKTYQGHCELLDDINFLINTLDVMNKRNKLVFTGGFTQYTKFIPERKIKNIINKLEKEQEQNRKELDIGINCLSNKMIDLASDKIVKNMYIREYLQKLLEEE